MQPHNPMLDTYRNLAGNVLELGRAHLTSPTLLADQQAEPAHLRTAKAAWRSVPGNLEAIDQAIADLGDAIVRISTDSRITDQAKADDIATAVTVTRSIVGNNTTAARASVTAILDAVREAAYPARPQPADVAQEAALAGLKADLRMVWDNTADDDLVPAMARSLSRAIGDQDDLATWLLASSRWPEDFLTSRGATVRLPAWQAEVATILDAASPANLSEARRLHRTLSDGRTGLPVLNVLFNQLNGVISDLSNWRPRSDSMSWSRSL